MIEYVDQVLSGQVLACQKIKWACERFKRDLSRSKETSFPFYYDEDEAAQAIKFIELMPKTDGSQLTMQPFQEWIISELYGWREKATGNRRYENVTVLDDCKSSAFDLRAFFSVFDPHQYSLSNSRNYDKYWLSDYAFLTCSDSYNDWVTDLMLFSTNGEKYTRYNRIDDYNPRVDWSKDVSQHDGWQVLRRTSVVIHVELDTVGSVARVYSLDDQTVVMARKGSSEYKRILAEVKKNNDDY